MLAKDRPVPFQDEVGAEPNHLVLQILQVEYRPQSSCFAKLEVSDGSFACFLLVPSQLVQSMDYSCDIAA